MSNMEQSFSKLNIKRDCSIFGHFVKYGTILLKLCFLPPKVLLVTLSSDMEQSFFLFFYPFFSDKNSLWPTCQIWSNSFFKLCFLHQISTFCHPLFKYITIVWKTFFFHQKYQVWTSCDLLFKCGAIFKHLMS